MARSLIANAFVFGSLFVAGAMANTPSDAFTDLRDKTTALNHAREEQKIACAYKNDLDQFNKLSKGEKKQKNAICKAADRNVAQSTKAQKRAQATLQRAMNAANKQCRADVARETKQCKKDCRQKLGKAAEATRDSDGKCACECKEGFYVPEGEAKCVKPKVALPKAAPAVRPCCEAGARKNNAALWRASYPTDAIDSGMPAIVTTPTTEESRITTVCDEEKRRNGGYAVRHELHRGDPLVGSSVRCESHTLDHQDSMIRRGQTRYYGMSLYFGPEWEINQNSTETWDSDILFQWKAFGCDESFMQCPGAKYPGFDSCSNCLSHQQQGSGDYPFMTIQQKRNGLVLRITGSDGNIAGQDQITIANEISKSEWHDIKMKVVWDDHTETDPAQGARGSIEIYHKLRSEAEYRAVPVYYSKHDRHVVDGKLTTKWTGPTMYGNHKAYLKWGLYEPHWNQKDGEAAAPGPQNRTIFHDNIAVGDCWKSVDPAAVDCESGEQQCDADQ